MTPQDRQSELDKLVEEDLGINTGDPDVSMSQVQEVKELIEAYVTTRVKNIKGIIKMSDTYTFEDGTKLYSEKALSTRVKEAERLARIDGQLIAIKLINELAGLDKTTFDNGLYVYMVETMKKWQEAYNLPATEIDNHLQALTTTTNGKDNSNA